MFARALLEASLLLLILFQPRSQHAHPFVLRCCSFRALLRLLAHPKLLKSCSAYRDRGEGRGGGGLSACFTHCSFPCSFVLRCCSFRALLRLLAHPKLLKSCSAYRDRGEGRGGGGLSACSTHCSCDRLGYLQRYTAPQFCPAQMEHTPHARSQRWICSVSVAANQVADGSDAQRRKPCVCQRVA